MLLSRLERRPDIEEKLAASFERMLDRVRRTRDGAGHAAALKRRCAGPGQAPAGKALSAGGTAGAPADGGSSKPARPCGER